VHLLLSNSASDESPRDMAQLSLICSLGNADNMLPFPRDVISRNQRWKEASVSANN
jgi:hypothetical protein